VEGSFDQEVMKREGVRDRLLESSLRLVAALRDAEEFPQDETEIAALIGRLAEGRRGESRPVYVEAADALPRYVGEFATWVAPAGVGCLRVRQEDTDPLMSEAIVLRPDGRAGEFETIEGFGVPEDELTERARADRDAQGRRAEQEAVEAAESDEKFEEAQTRFATANLLTVIAAPVDQDPSGPVIAYVTLYETGLMVVYLVPRPSDEELEAGDDDPFAEPLFEASFPSLELDDGLGTGYEVVDIATDVNDPMMRSRLGFTPAVPAAAERLRITIGSAAVEIELGAR
jgi:hypothetical protein